MQDHGRRDNPLSREQETQKPMLAICMVIAGHHDYALLQKNRCQKLPHFGTAWRLYINEPIYCVIQ